MGSNTNSARLFSFPPQQPGDTNIKNWYQDLIDDPNCQGDPAKIQEAYTSFRQAGLSKSIAALLPPDPPDNESKDSFQTAVSNSASASIIPDAALIKHLSYRRTSIEEDELSTHDVNCLVIWARPTAQVLELLHDIQQKLTTLVGDDLYPIRAVDMHLSVLELSHRHSVSHLRFVYAQVGNHRLQKMLDLPFTLASGSGNPDGINPSAGPPDSGKPNGIRACLVEPQVMFDAKGVAVGFVPAARPNEVDSQFTYNHLRASLQNHALESGVEIDTCYTAPLAHVTIGRFVGNKWFGGDDAALGNMKRERMQRWVEEIENVNEWLRRVYWEDKKRVKWVVGAEKGLEVQLGYVKFGRGSEDADLVGRPVPL
ncbi:hypothetical protein BDY21DRAFT_283040 [Lineolata rhizophorae]|uniref:RNA ligase/cyclic nucleotide phosphodiesterase n=1 Tax=Lineolata rhizophorae TaxID=578093 RepID=A0A6A6P4P8_9PEZI|nr:hypothetical protein BDY21DRAFT_283040 [Lineolata rhizophorae]